jgi:hypothetical protein
MPMIAAAYHLLMRHVETLALATAFDLDCGTYFLSFETRKK